MNSLVSADDYLLSRGLIGASALVPRVLALCL